MVYNPLETPLLKLAKERGIPVISGLEMFVQQGARQFEIWTGKPAPEAEMLRVVELELRRRGSVFGLRRTTTVVAGALVRQSREAVGNHRQHRAAGSGLGEPGSCAGSGCTHRWSAA
jgi:hypothetical protein